MGRLGDMLEVVFGPGERFQTVRATIRHWRNRDLADKADGGNRGVMGRRKVGEPSPTPQVEESILSVWVSRPDRLRIEKRRQVDDRTEISVTVVNGDRSWKCDSEGHVETREGVQPSMRGETTS